MKKLDEYILGESTSDAIRVETRQENVDAALLLVKQCKLKLAIISHQLDPFVYDQAEFVEAIRQLALKGRYVDIRIIAFEPTLIIRRGHKLGKERYTGTVNFNGRRGSKNMLKVFDRMWATSEPDPNFRRILI